MNDTRRMHYVPRTYLKHFSEKRGEDYFIHKLNRMSLIKFQDGKFSF